MSTKSARVGTIKISGFILLGAILLNGCRTTWFSNDLAVESVRLPALKNSANECYYLDEFMPTPDGMVSGRAGAMNLRYYSYKAATYKEWKGVQINLAFYSSDLRCWSLFEEFYSKE